MAETDRAPEPWWGKLFPDVRGWATIGSFALAFYTLYLISAHPNLASNEIFKTAVILLLGTGGLGLVYSFLWGGSKASVQAADSVNEIAKGASSGAVAAAAAATSAAGPAPGASPVAVTVTNEPDNPVPVASQDDTV